MSDVEVLRQRAMHQVLVRKRQSAPRLGGAYLVSHTGYNYGQWATRGFNIALSLLESAEPQAGETGADFLWRVVELVKAQRDAYRSDAADEDGACSGALDAAMSAIADVLPEASPGVEHANPLPADPGAETKWEVWYRDTFDHDCPPSIDTSGHDLANGLAELWARHLFETVRPDGRTGFSRFHLRWEQLYIDIKGDWDGAVCLREWVFGAQEHTRVGYIEAGDAALLAKIARVHAALLPGDRSGEQILAAAAAAASRPDFEARLSKLID